MVWFGEAVPLFQRSAEIVATADIILIIGTSMQVYPAASLVDFATNEAMIYFIDPNPNINGGKNLKIINKKAVEGVPQLVNEFLNEK